MNELPKSSFLPQLLALFYSDPSTLGEFRPLPDNQLPPEYRQLLEHDGHMTVTLEEFHRSDVLLEVLSSQRRDACYVRKIALRRTNDQRVVLFGVVRLNLRLLPTAAAEEIRDEATPLGHVLIRHQVLREVERLAAWQVKPGPELKSVFGAECPETLYGRTAIIHCNGEPAIELLEIVIA